MLIGFKMKIQKISEILEFVKENALMLVHQKNNTIEDSLQNGVLLVKLQMKIFTVNNLLRSLLTATSTTEDHA